MQPVPALTKLLLRRAPRLDTSERKAAPLKDRAEACNSGATRDMAQGERIASQSPRRSTSSDA